mmetsp:Transcript_20380/g.29171  ORF Transcript_20380/g.29171 Transcript_20380/m.29171 type:complete len:243 (+) Transcript_20380:195-923(+)|eukprot:CAMPEP_0201691568 /NCGR_PEP_ID=MMETSP0578-20130828/4703_1 /ASSEMBLY_ACC=CAM_ASM_000663 /TAXON_ID=267565 /ORGANISM="Skeletonema grethea, Strain CCMP 1804" /LENGTH=242 /DNA_ID=CAMNT_0048176803 /DNA_START=260 /DNA_END=988 /DNA_ORIENTATION=-
MTMESRDVIMKQIASQAAQVRHTFETSSKRHANVSSATAAAALHMANLNKRRRLEKSILSNDEDDAPSPSMASNGHSGNGHYFHSAIASFTRPEPTKPIIDNPVSTISDGITLQSPLGDIVVNPNDVIQGNGKTTQSLVGNKRYRVWIDLHSAKFAKALPLEERVQIATSVVNTVQSSAPQGRFLSMDINTGFWHEMGHENAVNMTMGVMMQSVVAHSVVVQIPAQQQQAVVQRKTYISRAA